MSAHSHELEGIPSKGALLLVRLFLAVALAVDGWLAWSSLSGGALAGCGPASDCHAVLQSRWAYWFGLPVSLPALLLYATLLAVTFLLNPQSPEARRRTAWGVLLGGALAVAGAAVWFIGLQLFVLRRICPFCMTAHGFALAASVLLLYHAPIRQPPRRKGRSRPPAFLPPRQWVPVGLSTLVLLTALVMGQTTKAPRIFVSDQIAAGVAEKDIKGAARQFQVFDGQFQFDLSQVPLIGRPDARHTLVSLFDYTCHHCRDLHGPLLEAQQRFSNDLAIVSLPMPLDGKCNPLIKRTQSPHTNACALATLGLTVWKADRAVWPKFEEWMFKPAQPPLPDQAQAYAEQLAGRAALERAATNEWVKHQLRQNIGLYEASYRKFRKGMMPQMIIGTNIVSGPVTRDQLYELLATHFGLKSP